MDWYSRYVVAWSLSNTLDAAFCVEALEKALSKGKPEVFNTDQGGEAFTGLLERHQVRIGMESHSPPSHISKMVLPTVHLGPPLFTSQWPLPAVRPIAGSGLTAGLHQL